MERLLLSGYSLWQRLLYPTHRHYNRMTSMLMTVYYEAVDRKWMNHYDDAISALMSFHQISLADQDFSPLNDGKIY